MRTSARLGLVCAALCALVLACSGGGGGDSVQGSTGGNVLFAADTNHQVVGAVASLNPPAGSSVTITQIPVSLLGPSIAYDPGRDELYVTAGLSIQVIAHASRASGSQTPSRVINPASTIIDVSSSMRIYLDVANDVLYVGGLHGSNAVVAAIGSASSANGTVSTARVMDLGTGYVTSFAVDTSRGMLYVIGGSVGVRAYSNALTASGSITPDYTFLTGAAVTNWLTLDAARDRLYVADFVSGIRIVNQASSNAGHADGGTVAVFNIQYVTVDPGRDRLYAAAGANAYIFNTASSLGSSSAAPGVVSMAPGGSNIAGFAFH